MSADLRHPDAERLAAYQAGELDEAALEAVAAHLGACAACAATVEAVAGVRARLAAVEEPPLPAGLHERLAAAVGAGAAPAEPVVLPRRAPWYRRPATLAVAAVLALFVVLPVALLASRDGGGLGVTRSEDGGERATAAAPGGPPVFQAPGEYSTDRLEADLRANQRMREAFLTASGTRAAAGGMNSGESAPSLSQDSGELAKEPATPRGPGDCATAASLRAGRGQRVAFLLDTTYQGRPATVVITTDGATPPTATLWAFPRGDCSAAPFATTRTTIRGLR